MEGEKDEEAQGPGKDEDIMSGGSGHRSVLLSDGSRLCRSASDDGDG